MIAVIDDTLAEFGLSMGMSDLALRDGEALVLDMQKLGTFAIELIGEHREAVSISLIRQIETPDAVACTKILELCHYRMGSPFPVRTGLTQSGQLFFAVRLEASEFTLPNIHLALDWLCGLHDQSSAFVRLT